MPWKQSEPISFKDATSHLTTLLKANGSGSFFEKITVIETKEIRTVEWYDNRAMTLASTFEGVNLCILSRDGDQSPKELVQVSCLSIIHSYQYMKGVDTLAALISYYLTTL